MFTLLFTIVGIITLVLVGVLAVGAVVAIDLLNR